MSNVKYNTMKKLLLILFIAVYGVSYAQNLSREHIIYEHKDQVVMNNGQQYKVVSNKFFYEINDQTIFQYKRVFDHVLRLNRVLILQSKTEQVQLIEWIKNDVKFYEYRTIRKPVTNSYTTIGK